MTTTADRDHDVVALLRTSHAAAFALLMHRHGTAVYRDCRAQLRDDADHRALCGA